MEFIDEEIELYAENHSSDEPGYLKELNRETWAKVLQPRMLSGHLQGRTLSMLSQLHQPKYILEIGTYTGYSALCLAEGLDNNGQLHTIDINEELKPIVERYVNKANMQRKIIQHIGNALEIIPLLNYKWDLVFIDADKENYLKYLELVKPALNKGALVIIDNVLWSGKVVHETKKGDEETAILKLLNQQLKEDKKFQTVMLPIRDGLTVSIFKG